MVKRCAHPKEKRSLLGGYDVYCGECENSIGRVALFPCAVLTRDEAAAMLNGQAGKAARDAKAKLKLATR
jgi:hypothetical protein